MIYRLTERYEERFGFCEFVDVKRGFRPGSYAYITGMNALNEDQREHILREGGFESNYASVAKGNAFGGSLIGSGGTAALIAAGPGLEGLYVLGGVGALIASVFAVFGTIYGRRALKERRARKACLPAGVKRFPVEGPQWDAMKKALMTLEAEETTSLHGATAPAAPKRPPLKDHQVVRLAEQAGKFVGATALRASDKLARRYSIQALPRIKPPAASSIAEHKEPVIWHIFMNALVEHTTLGETIEPTVSFFMLDSERVVDAMRREDQMPKWVAKAEKSLQQAAVERMRYIYEPLASQRDLEGFAPGECATENEYKSLRTRGEAAAEARSAIECMELMRF